MSWRGSTAVLLACLAAAVVAGGCGSSGGGDSTATAPPPPPPGAPASAGGQRPPAPDDPIQVRPGGSKDPAHGHQDDGAEGHGPPPGAFPPPRPQPGTKPPTGADENGIRRTVDAYIRALDDRDGRAVCALFEPGALRALKLPRRQGGCAGSVTASIGYAGPGGQPRWIGSRLANAGSIVLVRGGDGRFTGTVVHRFSGSREPSIEDDVIYLRRDRGRWLIVQPSTTFYRAIGVGDVPLSALTPPKD